MRSIFLVFAITACAGTKRSPATYRADTQRVLETRSTQLTQCYEKAFATDPAATGVVAVRFVVEKKTGLFTKASIDPAASKAGEALTLCVLDSLAGLRLEPADRNEGQASFVFVLQPG
jgi:hypothetical protein